jgi:hypothetical protein
MAVLKKNENALAMKKDANQKIKERRQKIDNLFKGSSGEPTINPIDYKISLIQALNWFNVFHTDKEKQAWALESISDKTIRNALSKLDDYLFRQVGTLIRLKYADNLLEPAELSYISNKMSELTTLATIEVEDKVVVKKNVIPIQDKIKALVDNYASEIDGEIDQYITNGYPKGFTFKNSPKALAGSVAKQVPSIYAGLIRELEEALANTCEQLTESYSNVKTVQLKRFIQLMKDFVSSCTQQVVSAKIVKVSKPKAPSVLVQTLKYLPKFEELDLTSENPIKIIGSSSLVLFDTVRRRLSYYVAEKDSTLSVKGTTIVGYDVEASGVKTIRDYDLVKDLKSMNKKQIEAKFGSIRTKRMIPNGRTNTNEIIIKTFK